MTELVAAIIGIIDVSALFLVAAIFGVGSNFTAKFPIVGSLAAKITRNAPKEPVDPAQAVVSLLLCLVTSSALVLATLAV